MSNEMTLFGDKSSTATALLQSIQDDLMSKLAGSGGGARRISIDGNMFREYIGGKEVRVSESRAIQVVIINASPIARTYYAGTYVKGQKAKPVCWSADTQTPAFAVPEGQRQSTFCKDCPQNIKGSASSGEGRACRFSQRLAVVLASDDKVGENVYQLSLPATSVFGDAEGQKMPMQAYGRYLKANGEHIIAVVTEVRFDPAGQMKLVFKGVRKLNDEELQKVVGLYKHPDTIKAITFTVSQADSSPDDDNEEFAPPSNSAVGVVASAVVVTSKPAKPKVEEVEVVTEPKKVAKKATAAEVTEKADLAAIVGNWED